jgi:hypothetical protein
MEVVSVLNRLADVLIRSCFVGFVGTATGSVRNPMRTLILFSFRGYIPLGREMPLIRTAKDSGIYFHATKPISHDVISAVLYTKHLSEYVSLDTKDYELQGQLMTFWL